MPSEHYKLVNKILQHENSQSYVQCCNSLTNDKQTMLLHNPNRDCSCKNAHAAQKNRSLLCTAHPPSVLFDSTNKYLIPQNKQKLKKKEGKKNS